MRRSEFKFGRLISIAVFGLATMLPISASFAGGRQVYTDVKLPYRIYSAPSPWADNGGSWAFAIVAASKNSHGPTELATEVDAYHGDGRHVMGYPVLAGKVMAVAPGNQLLGGNKEFPPSVVAIDGTWRALHRFNASNGVGGHPSLGLMAGPPLALGSPVASYVCIGRNYQPYIESRNELLVLQSGGTPHPGYPVALAGEAENRPPVIDAKGERVWVMLESGQVDGFLLANGARLGGFPTETPRLPRPTGGFRLVAHPGGNLLFVATGGPTLLRVDSQTGALNPLPLTQAQRITGLAWFNGQLVVFDEGRGKLVALDDKGIETASFGLTAPGALQNVALMPLTGNALLVESAPRVDYHARVEQMFREQAPPSEQARLAALAEKEAKARFRTVNLSPAQTQDMERDLLSLKDGWLEKKYGLFEMNRMLKADAATRIQVVMATPSGWTIALDDTISGHTPETGFHGSEMVYPVVWNNTSGETLLLVPVNSGADHDDQVNYFRSLVRIYTLLVR